MAMFWILLKTGLLYGALCLLVYVIGGILITMVSNYQAQQLFKKRSPNLPILPNTNIFTGHLIQMAVGHKTWKNLEDYHRKFGRTVGGFLANKPIVSTLDLDFIKSIVLDKPYENLNRVRLGSLIEELEYDNLLFCETEQWRRLRQAIAPAFKSHKLKTPIVREELKSIINKLLDSFEDRIKMDKETEVNIDDLSNRFSMDIVLTCFYKKPNSIDYLSKTNPWVERVHLIMLSAANILTFLSVTFPFLGKLFGWYVNNFHIQAKLRDDVFALIREATRSNLEAKREHESQLQPTSGQDQKTIDNVLMRDGSIFRRNMIDYVIDQHQAGRINNREYMNNSYVLFLGGNKSTGDAISKVFYFLTMNQSIQNKLRQCIFTEGIDSQYLTWVILETLRLFPSIPHGSSRILNCDKITSDGYLIPKGVSVITPINTIHRLKEYWGADADEFRPERWSESSNFHPCQYLAFGVGPRGCIGKDMAIMDTKMLIDAVLRRFKFEKTKNTPTKIDLITPMQSTVIFTTPSYIKIAHLTEDDLKFNNAKLE